MQDRAQSIALYPPAVLIALDRSTQNYYVLRSSAMMIVRGGCSHVPICIHVSESVNTIVVIADDGAPRSVV